MHKLLEVLFSPIPSACGMYAALGVTCVLLAFCERRRAR